MPRLTGWSESSLGAQSFFVGFVTRRLINILLITIILSFTVYMLHVYKGSYALFLPFLVFCCQFSIQLLNILILIGGWGNTKSVIRTSKQQDPPAASLTHKPLDCAASKAFWVSWARGQLQVGSGMTVGADKFLSYSGHSSPTVNFIAVSTGFGSSGTWAFGKINNIAGRNLRNDLGLEYKEVSNWKVVNLMHLTKFILIWL